MNPPEFTQDSHELIKQQVESYAAVLIDVREQDEWNASHLELAILVPVSEMANDDTRAAALARIPRDKPVYCHCYRGVRAWQVAEFLNQLGYDIRPLRDDYEDLAASVFDEVK